MKSYLFLMGGLLIVGCTQATQAVERQAAELAITMVAQTELAPVQEVTALPPTIAPTEVSPTETPIPEPTETPGPIVFHDDFSEDSGNWLGCEVCEWDEGGLIIGPYSDSVTGEIVHVICGPCGETSNYRMAVDVTHYDGMAGGGFGFLLYEDDVSAVEYRISVWQIAGLDHIEHGTNTVLVGEHTTLIRPSTSTNRLEVIVTDSPSAGRSDIRLMVNDKTIQVYSGMKISPTQVGLKVTAVMGVLFDNFEFEELES